MNKTLRLALVGLVVIFLLLSSFSSGLIIGHFLPSYEHFLPTAVQVGAVTPEAQAATPSYLQTLFKPFWESWQVVHDQYVDQPVDDIKLMQGAIRGLLESLGDEHTSYMDPEEFKDANAELSGEYEGIGAWVDTTSEFLVIVSPMSGSPAERAGLKPGDQVLTIDGEDMTGVDSELARRKVLGPVGTTVRLTIRRKDVEDPLEFIIRREQIKIQSVQGKMLDNGIAYVQVITFGDKTSMEMRQTLTQLMVQNPAGMILDLRNNGGGYLNTAIEIASQFIDHGVIMYEQYGNGERQSYQASAGGAATKIPLVVLINKGTASASEIVAAAIQDYGRGILVGVTSYGKGSVQNWTPLSDNQGAVRVTIAKWLTPKGRIIHKIGLTPDVVVEISDEDMQASRDPQLDKAVELLILRIDSAVMNIK